MTFRCWAHGDNPTCSECAEHRARARAIRAVVAAQWVVMVTIADWCAAFVIDPEVHGLCEIVHSVPWMGFAGVGVVALNLAALPTPEEIVDGDDSTEIHR